MGEETRDEPLTTFAWKATSSPDMSEITVKVSGVQYVLDALDVTKATGPDKILAKLL